MLRKLLSITLIITIGFFTLGCGQTETLADPTPVATDNANYRKAVFAGGCFWCMEKPFDIIPGVVDTTSGYTGGTKENPTYRQVSSGTTGHAEAVQVTYDPEKVKYDTLLKTYWRNIDPLDEYGQFCDKGTQYRSAIFYTNENQKQAAEASKAELTKSGRFEKPIVTEITEASQFYPAEDYHQNYYKTNSTKYKIYRFGCGRDQRLNQLWGDEAGK